MTTPSDRDHQAAIPEHEAREDVGRGLGVGLTMAFGFWLGVVAVIVLVFS